jgi:hypothetical protein
MGDVERLAEELARICAPVAPSQHCPEVGERASALESRACVLECVDRLAEQQLSMLPPGHETRRAERNATGARSTEGPRELELVVRKAPGAFATSERKLGKRSLRSPRQEARGDDLSPHQHFTHRQNVVEPFCDAPLLESQPAAGEPKERRVERRTLCLGVDRGKRFLGRGELTLIGEGFDEQAGLEDTVDRRGWKLGRRQRGPAVDVGGAQVTAPEC